MLAQKYKELATLITVLLLVVLNVISLSSGLFFYDLPGSINIYFHYFYWAEGVFLAFFALITFAKRFIVFFIILSAAALLLRMTTDAPLGDPGMHLIFWALYSLCWIAYIDLRRKHMGLIMKRRHPAHQLLVYLGFMTASITACFYLTISICNIWGITPDVPEQLYGIFVAMAVLVPTLSIGLLKIIDMIGAKHFLQLLIGTYYRPVEKDRIVLFIDMVGSTAIAEKMGPLYSINLVARFIFDATGIFRIYGGDVVNYTGDGLLVTWPRRQADRPVMAVIALRSRLRSSIPFYLKEFGVVPDFRVGIHSGKVIISQVGEEKQFLALYGDTVNTAGRLEQINKELNTKVLISGELLKNMSKSCQNLLQPLGMKFLKGKDDSVEIFTLRREQTA